MSSTQTPSNKQYIGDQVMSMIATSRENLFDLVLEASEAGYRVSPSDKTGKTLPFAHDKTLSYTEKRYYKRYDVDRIALILDRVVLLDYDANKADGDIISLQDLAKLLGEELPPPFQTNESGDSLHYLFRLPDDVDLDTINQANNGRWLKHIDIKTGNGVCHIKVGKYLPNGILGISSLHIAPTVLINALEKKNTKIKPTSDTATVAVPETDENIRLLQSALLHIPSDVKSGCTRDIWRNIIWAIASLNWSQGYQIARTWSQASPSDFDEEAFNSIWNSFNPDREITCGTVMHYARKNGYIGPGLEINSLVSASNSDNLLAEMTPVGEFTIFEGVGGDTENGALFAEKFRNQFLFVRHSGCLQFDPVSGWLTATEEDTLAKAKAVVSDMREDMVRALRSGQDDRASRLHRHIKATQRLVGLKAMVEIARSEPNMTVDIQRFDADPFLFGVRNGVLDLKAGTLLDLSPKLLVSKRANVAFDPTAECPLFKSSLNAWQPDRTMQKFLQQLCGIFLTGEPHIHKLIFFYGLGANGKSVLIETIHYILGEYSTVMESESLMKQNRSSQGPSPDIVALKGVRLAICNELNEGSRLDESRVKAMTGGDTLKGRAMYAKEAISFKPSHNLVMVGNHQPAVSDSTEGMWRRMTAVPFTNTIPERERDSELSNKLKKESSGILNWMLSGLQDYLENGLTLPDTVNQATEAYRDDEDILGQFIREETTRELGGKVSISVLYNSYQNWCAKSGQGTLSRTNFTRRLKSSGYSTDPGKRNFIGLVSKPISTFR